MADVRGRLALESGATYEGMLFGAPLEHPHNGEVVFNTCMTGYQEVITDPSYAGQVVVMTYPLIGNYGCRDDTAESEPCAVPRARGARALRRHRACSRGAHARGGVAAQWDSGAARVDTRALTRHLRDHGTLRGVIASSSEMSAAEQVETARSAPFVSDEDLVGMVSIDEPLRPYTEPLDPTLHRGVVLSGSEHTGRGLRVVVLDYGVKLNQVARAVQPRCRGHPRPSGRAHRGRAPPQSRRDRALQRPGRSLATPARGPALSRSARPPRAAARHLPRAPDPRASCRCIHIAPRIRTSRREPSGARCRKRLRVRHLAEPRVPGRRCVASRRIPGGTSASAT